jgi:hypothetical protein
MVTEQGGTYQMSLQKRRHSVCHQRQIPWGQELRFPSRGCLSVTNNKAK